VELLFKVNDHGPSSEPPLVMVMPIACSSRSHGVRDAYGLKAQSRSLRCKPRTAFHAAETTNRAEQTKEDTPVAAGQQLT
jgi:hypothetical protein